MPVKDFLPGFETPAAGFDEPFDMLSACHDRVRRSLHLLARLQTYLVDHPADEQARGAAKDVLRYFSMAAPAHHEDEERHLVPLLQQSGEPRLRRAASRLLQDHADIRRAWQDLEPLLEGVVSGIEPDLEALTAAAERFIRLHDSHLELEDELVFPSARELKEQQGAAAMAEMGQEMASRRLAVR